MYGAETARQYSAPKSSNSANAVDTILKLILFVIIFLAGGISYHIAIENGVIPVPGNEPTQEVQGATTQNSEDLTTSQKVAAKLFIPQDEDPTLATISDVEQLRFANPNFYFYAQNGDKLLVYSDRAVIYREEEDIIINVVPVQRGEDVGSEAGQ